MTSPASIQISSKPILTLSIKEASSKQEYRGRCRYGTGLNCPNERTFKHDGEAHRMCEKHRTAHNQTQRKTDRKRRASKRTVTKLSNDAYKHVARPCITLSSHFLSPSMENIAPTPLSEMKWFSTSSFDADVSEMDDHWQWSNEEVDILQTIMKEGPLDLSSGVDMPPVKSEFKCDQ